MISHKNIQNGHGPLHAPNVLQWIGTNTEVKTHIFFWYFCNNLKGFLSVVQ